MRVVVIKCQLAVCQRTLVAMSYTSELNRIKIERAIAEAAAVIAKLEAEVLAATAAGQPEDVVLGVRERLAEAKVAHGKARRKLPRGKLRPASDAMSVRSNPVAVTAQLADIQQQLAAMQAERDVATAQLAQAVQSAETWRDHLADAEASTEQQVQAAVAEAHRHAASEHGRLRAKATATVEDLQDQLAVVQAAYGRLQSGADSLRADVAAARRGWADCSTYSGTLEAQMAAHRCPALPPPSPPDCYMAIQTIGKNRSVVATADAQVDLPELHKTVKGRRGVTIWACTKVPK